MDNSAQVPNALQTSVTGLKWFKIYQDGFSGGAWGVDRFIQNKGKITFAIPSCIPAGQYLLRVEIIGRFSELRAAPILTLNGCNPKLCMGPAHILAPNST